jgi:hypothetical protein
LGFALQSYFDKNTRIPFVLEKGGVCPAIARRQKFAKDKE